MRVNNMHNNSNELMIIPLIHTIGSPGLPGICVLFELSGRLKRREVGRSEIMTALLTMTVFTNLALYLATTCLALEIYIFNSVNA